MIRNPIIIQSQRRYKKPYGAAKLLRLSTPMRPVPRISTRGYGRYKYGRNYPYGRTRQALRSKETGFVDLAHAGYAADTTGSVTLIATVAQGVSVNQRIGKKMRWKSMQIRGTVQANAASTVSGAAWMIIYDKKPQAALPAVVDILNTANCNSFLNDANSGRFTVLKRMDYSLSGNTTTPATGNECEDVNEFLNLKSRKFAGTATTTGAIGAIETGALYLVTVGDTAVGTGAATVALGFRTRFRDD